MKKFAIAIHGGAGTILRSNMSVEKERQYKSALEEALNNSYEILLHDGTALDAVEQAVVILEDCPLFNAGKGSVFTHDGRHEMDASIMDGLRNDGGAVCLLSNIKNPIKLARLVLEKSEHVMLAGEGAEIFAKEQGIEFADPEYFYNELRHNQLLSALASNEIILDHTEIDPKKFGTVGAVALDKYGHLAAATSTGGMTNKKWGRIGDTPILGAGTYANNESCAVSCTGSGEYFIRSVVAFHIHSLMVYARMNLIDACYKVIHEILPSMGGDGGLIAIDKHGSFCLDFNTDGMYRAFQSSHDQKIIDIYK